MGYKRHTRKRVKNNNGKLVLPLLFFLLALWLGLSSIKGKSPTELVSDLYSWVINKKQSHPSRAELKETLSNKDSVIDSLYNVIEVLENKSPYRTAIVNTTANSLNLRSQPNLSSDVVIKIPDSSAVKILYFDEEVLVLDGETGKWCKIKYADKEGWVWGNYLELEQ